MTPGTAGDAPWLSLKVVIRCRELSVSRSFYGGVLGLPVVEEWTETQGRGCVFGFGPQGQAGFLEVYEMTAADPRYRRELSEPLPVDKIDVQLGAGCLDAWVRRLHGAWPFEGPERLPWGQRWVRLRDPDGILVALYEGHDPGRPQNQRRPA